MGGYADIGILGYWDVRMFCKNRNRNEVSKNMEKDQKPEVGKD
jgi:hypothetical protein